jgi:hypothetical protein
MKQTAFGLVAPGLLAQIPEADVAVCAPGRVARACAPAGKDTSPNLA